MQHDPPLYPYKKLTQHPSKEGVQMNMTTASPSAASTPAPALAASAVALGPSNTVMVCPFCQASIKTAVKYTTTTRTHIAASLCCIVCCCCCIPYCSESAKNADHYCPNCQRYLGTYEK